MKLWSSYVEYFLPYTDEQVGRLVMAMLDYALNGVVPEFNGEERFVWPAIKRDIDEGKKAAAAVSQKRSESGRRGGRPKKAEKKEEDNNLGGERYYELLEPEE